LDNDFCDIDWDFLSKIARRELLAENDFKITKKNYLGLDQGFPTCGTRTTSGTPTGIGWYAETFKIKANPLKIELFFIL
jgi:hypothetical protein